MDSFGHLTSDSLSLVMDFCDRSAGWFDGHNGAGRTLREREREKSGQGSELFSLARPGTWSPRYAWTGGLVLTVGTSGWCGLYGLSPPASSFRTSCRLLTNIDQ